MMNGVLPSSPAKYILVIRASKAFWEVSLSLSTRGISVCIGASRWKMGSGPCL